MITKYDIHFVLEACRRACIRNRLPIVEKLEHVHRLIVHGYWVGVPDILARFIAPLAIA